MGLLYAIIQEDLLVVDVQLRVGLHAALVDDHIAYEVTKVGWVEVRKLILQAYKSESGALMREALHQAVRHLQQLCTAHADDARANHVRNRRFWKAGRRLAKSVGVVVDGLLVHAHRVLDRAHLQGIGR